MKKLGVAAAMMLCAASMMASNFRGADQVYVPAAGHLSGSSGTFISDVFISNLESEPVVVSVIYATGQGGTQQEFKNVIRLAANERKEYVDFFISGLGQTCTGGQTCFGQLVFNACKEGGDCSAANQDAFGFSRDFRNISVESRIYSIPVGKTLADNPPTTGQLFSGIPWYNFVTSLQSQNKLDKVFITGIRQTGGVGQAGTYRANIGLTNASQYSTTTLVVRLFNGATNQQIGSDFTIQMSPMAHIQKNLTDLFPGVSGTNLWVTVEQRNNVATGDAPSTCTEGCPAFLAYGSILDNVSGDATTLEAQYMVALSTDAVNFIYGTGAGKTPIRRVVHH